VKVHQFVVVPGTTGQVRRQDDIGEGVAKLDITVIIVVIIVPTRLVVVVVEVRNVMFELGQPRTRLGRSLPRNPTGKR
jgi:hypothetical protein